MNTERWEKLDQLFHAALEREPSGRAAYLVEACGDDDHLRQELYSMLDHHDQANSFIESPACAIAFEAIFNADQGPTLAGQSFGPYQIDRVLGKGGMGVVYLAFDRELQRRVALKFLQDDLLSDKQRVQRFKQEARAASALNHPNILTIHQIGEIDGRQFIATEFVEGLTLRETIKLQRLDTGEALDIAIQIASALSAAHAADIIHRDIKPENIMIRPDGYVKVLDFGLAKLIEGAAPFSEVSTMLNTEQGAILGTVQYMSPEQARGQTLDVRTDIWSLGVVLYEMLTAHAPFSGETKSDVIAAILEREPLPLSKHIPGVTGEVQSLVSKSLKKDRAHRQQTAKEIFRELSELKQRPEVQIDFDRARSVRPSAARTGAGPDSQMATRTLGIERARATSSVEYLISGIKEHKTGVAAMLLSMVIAIPLVAIWYFHSSSGKSVAHPLAMNMTRLATSGNMQTATISPDGKSIAYVVSETACCFLQSIRLRRVDITSDIQIDPPGALYHQHLVFSPDGNYLYFTDGADNLYRMPAFGGPKTRLLGGVSSPLSFSPDGKQIAFLRRDYPTHGESTLMVANSDGTREQQISSRKKPDFFDGGPSWSPTKAAIACGAGGVDDRGRYMSVIEVPLDHGEQRQITSERWDNVGPLVWLSDGSALLMLAEEPGSAFAPQLWEVSYPAGSAHRITNELNRYEELSVSADARTVVTEQISQPSNIWVESKPGQTRQLTSAANGSYENLSWIAEKQLIFDSNNSGQWDIWHLETDKGFRTQLTMNAGANGDSSISPDGRFIVFASTRAGPLNIWKMDADGANLKQLTSGNNEDDNPHCTPDGKWVVYESTRADKTTLWKVAVDGGPPVQLIEKPSRNAAISPDGRWVFYQSTDAPRDVSFVSSPEGNWVANNSTGETTIWRVSIDGGRPVELVNRYSTDPIIARQGNLMEPVISPDGKMIACRYQPDTEKNIWKVAIVSLKGIPIQVFDISAHPFWDSVGFRWSPDGRAITYRSHQNSVSLGRLGTDNLWNRPIDGNPPKQLTNFESDQIFSFAWSRDGQLALSRGIETRDVILLTNFR